MEVTVFVEGGGDSPAQHAQFRKNFHALLARAGLSGKKPRVAVCGGRSFAYKDFKNYRGGYGILLVDSESPISPIAEGQPAQPWEHLQRREGDKWSKPAHTKDEQCHLMVQCMEAWLIADKAALKQYFGPDFKESKLPQNTNIPAIPKANLLSGLENATKTCRKGCYSKGKHSFELLGLIDPGKIKDKCTWARRFFETLDEVMAK